MYSLRDDYPKDPKAILKKVAEMGYNQIDKGPKRIKVFSGACHLQNSNRAQTASDLK